MHSLLPTGIYLFCLLALLSDVYQSNDTFLKFTHVHSYTVAWVSLAVLIIIRIFKKARIDGYSRWLNTHFVFPIAFVVGCTLTIFDSLSPINYVYSLTHLQYVQICLIAGFSGIVGFLSLNDQFIEKNYQRLIFLGSFVYLFTCYIASLFRLDIFARLSKEDKFVESLQVSILLIGVYFALALAKKSSALGKYILTVFFSAAVVGLFFVAMDEVSWGQRIFNTQTPDVLIRNNVQEETTIHNLSYFQEKIGIGYLIIGIYGSLAWLIAPIVVRRNKSLRYFVPPWYLSGYFFLGFLYNFYSLINPLQSLGDWAESAELMIYCGIMLTLFSIWYENKDHKKTI